MGTDRRPSHPYLDHPGPIPIAHRGGALERAENTMAAFANAVELGYRYVETDVHATVDNVVVAFHDNDLARVTDGDTHGLISELLWSVVADARVGGERIPQLEEVMTTWPQLRVNIDPKTDTAVEPLIDVLDRTGSLDRVCIGAFSDERLQRFDDRFGDAVCLGLGPNAVRRLRFWLPLRQVPGRVAQVPPVYRGVPLTDRCLIRRAHRHGIAVHVWTIDDRAHMEKLLDRGADAIMTDRPALLKQVFQERGLWQ